MEKETIEGHLVEYQIATNQKEIWGRFIIKGPVCSSANTSSMRSELKGELFSSRKEARSRLKIEAKEKIKQASYFHPSILGEEPSIGSICLYCNRKISIKDGFTYN